MPVLCKEGGSGLPLFHSASSREGGARRAAKWLGRDSIPWVRRLFLLVVILLGLYTIAWAMSPQRRLQETIPGPFPDRPAVSWQFANDEAFRQAAARWPSLTNLIIVPGHAVHRCTSRQDLLREASGCWYLLDYQRGQSAVFLAHIRKALELAREDLNALLVFSGGQTRGPAGPRSEAESYWEAAMLLLSAEENNGPSTFATSPLRARMALEEDARDSLENVAFSLCRFRQLTGRLPRRVTVVGFPFKERRFRELHFSAIRQTGLLGDGNEDMAFDYVSVGQPRDTAPAMAGQPGDTVFDSALARQPRDTVFDSVPAGQPRDTASDSALARQPRVTASDSALAGQPRDIVDDAYELFKKDPLGVDPPLSVKRRDRNPFRRALPPDCPLKRK